MNVVAVQVLTVGSDEFKIVIVRLSLFLCTTLLS